MTKKKAKTKLECIKVIFVEGDADKIVFEKLVDYYHSKGLKKQIKIINTNGFPDEKEMRKGLERIRRCSKTPVVFDAVVCEYDTDVFVKNLKLKPDWKKVEDNLKRLFEVEHFCRIQAKTSIEDWMLDDLEGLLKALDLPLDTQPKGQYGQNKVKALFHRKNIVYDRYKGREKIKPYLDKLDIAKIRDARSKELKEFEKLLGVKINSSRKIKE